MEYTAQASVQNKSNESLTKDPSQCVRNLPACRFGFREPTLPNDVQARMDQEIERAIENSKSERMGKSKQEKKEHVALIRSEIENRYWSKQYDTGRIHEILALSLNSLSFLKTQGVQPVPDKISETAAMKVFMEHIKTQLYPELDSRSRAYLGQRRAFEDTDSPSILGPNTYFEEVQPLLIRKFGYPFFSSLKDATFSEKSPRGQEEQLLEVNVNFFAAFLGGEKRFLHDVMFYLPENRFYFYDPFSDYYLPTTDEKILLGLSHTIQRVCWGLPVSQVEFILAKFNSKDLLREILFRAKALLATDRGFFEGNGTKQRFIAEMGNDQSDVIEIQLFIEEMIQKDQQSVLTVAECMQGWQRFSTLRAVNFPDAKLVKRKIQEVIHKAYHKGLRNDLILSDGSSTRGWKGLKLRDQNSINGSQVEEVFEVGKSGRSEPSASTAGSSDAAQAEEPYLTS